MRLRPGHLRLFGVLLFGVLLWQLDLAQVARVLAGAAWPLLLLALALNVPQLLCKVVRWRLVLRAQQVHYRLAPATLAYFGSIFIGLLTPGRLGEFVKALHVRQDCDVSGGRALASVLVDRLFDLYMLLAVGGLALVSVSLGQSAATWAGFGLLALGLSLPLVVLFHERSYAALWRLATGWAAPDNRLLVRLRGWLDELRAGVRVLRLPTVLAGAGLTVAAYGILFGQCYLAAQAVALPLGFVPVSFAVALGSLITLLPISISGIGTRDALIIAYLGSLGIASEQALSFSLLVFVTFYLGGGLLGAGAWLLKPVPLAALRQAQAGEPQERQS